jgi:hypothetical protein
MTDRPGASAPKEARSADGRRIALEPLARAICRRYGREFDDSVRYGDAAHDWCVHDTQYVLAWAIQQARDETLDLVAQIRWLASLLGARGFPLERLARNLEIASEVTASGPSLGALAEPVSQSLAAVSRLVIPPRRPPTS